MHRDVIIGEGNDLSARTGNGGIEGERLALTSLEQVATGHSTGRRVHYLAGVVGRVVVYHEHLPPQIGGDTQVGETPQCHAQAVGAVIGADHQRDVHARFSLRRTARATRSA